MATTVTGISATMFLNIGNNSDGSTKTGSVPLGLTLNPETYDEAKLRALFEVLGEQLSDAPLGYAVLTQKTRLTGLI